MFDNLRVAVLNDHASTVYKTDLNFDNVYFTLGEQRAPQQGICKGIFIVVGPLMKNQVNK